MFGSRVGFLKIKADAEDNQSGNFIPGICFLRGSSVAILVIIECCETKEQFVVLVRQARVPVGEYRCTELPAGMLDGNGNFTGTAAKEIKEELGMDIGATELKLLNKDVSPSPGGCDEKMTVYYVKKTVSKDEIQKLDGKQTGVEAEGENIRVVVVPMKEIKRYFTDGKVLMAFALYSFQKTSS